MIKMYYVKKYINMKGKNTTNIDLLVPFQFPILNYYGIT